MKPIPFLDEVVEGDCLELLADLPENCIDMILCDLPYGTTQNPWDRIIDLGKLWPLYRRILKPRGVIALTAHGLFTRQLIMSNPDWYRYKIVWIKSKAPNFLQAGRQPLKKHEDICIFYREPPIYHPQMTLAEPYDRGMRKTNATGNYGSYHGVHTRSNGQRHPIDVQFFEEDTPDWVYCKTAETEGRTVHRSQKPVALGRYLIRMFTDPGAIVLDNACGSGSFLVAALLEGRYYIGMERNSDAYYLKTQPADFIQVCRQRLEQARLAG